MKFYAMLSDDRGLYLPKIIFISAKTKEDAGKKMEDELIKSEFSLGDEDAMYSLMYIAEPSDVVTIK